MALAYIRLSGTHGAAITVINSDKDLKLFSDIFIGGKLRLKLLRSERSEEWPSNLIYNEEYFDNSDDFCVNSLYIFLFRISEGIRCKRS